MNDNFNNKKYFKDTFNIFHAPSNVAQEVFNMAKNSEKNDLSNNNKILVTQAEHSQHHFGRFVAIACVCVLMVGGGVYLNSIGGNQVSTNVNDFGIGTSDSSTIETSKNQITNENFDIIKNSASDLKYAIWGDIDLNFDFVDTNTYVINQFYDICISQEWSTEPVVEENQDNSITLCTGYTMNSNEIELNSNVSVTIYADGSMLITIDEGDNTNLNINMMYNKNGSKFYNEVYKMLFSENSETINLNDTSQNWVNNSNLLFGIIPIDKNISISSMCYQTIGEESECTFNYDDLQKINEWSCYDMWTKLTSDPIGQDFSYENAITMNFNNGYKVEIIDTSVIVTIPNGDISEIEYYSTNETCGTDTFAQKVASLINEKSVPQ